MRIRRRFYGLIGDVRLKRRERGEEKVWRCGEQSFFGVFSWGSSLCVSGFDKNLEIKYARVAFHVTVFS